ncbi:unnamed protein product [Schistosoma curassoni]|uniref:RH1 domain-containing protein n=1 Tax=Schistosoma curassoni TaxID=6186 RepID=A0A183JEM8_9TREM|nr:unnamed protein product [Schistosoma curassoni]
MDNYIQAGRRLQSSDDHEDAISSTDDGSQPISQSVQDLANDIYKEFESLIKLYGNGFLHNLMPLVIRALENLDSLHSENSDLHLKSLVLSDDHRLLSAEYEKEKKLRKAAENRLFRLEDDLEEERRQHEEKTVSYDANVRILENRVKSLNEQTKRLSEPCFDELSQGDLPEDDGHDIKSHDGSCTTPQPQSSEPLGSEFAEPVELEVDGDLTDYAGYWSPCTPLVWNQGFPTPLGGLCMSTNPGKALDIRFSQNFQFSSELNALITNRASMLLRIKDLEQENGQLRREFENSDLYGSLPGDEISESEVGLLFQELFSP